MMENLEMRLLEQLKYKEGLDTQKLSELVKLATKLFEGIAKPQAKAAKLSSAWWWMIRGTPRPDRIAFEVILEREQVLELINTISKLTEVRNVLSSVEISPGLASGPEPDPWKVAGSLGADPTPEPWKGGAFGSFGAASNQG
jgi:hypothetical protein